MTFTSPLSLLPPTPPFPEFRHVRFLGKNEVSIAGIARDSFLSITGEIAGIIYNTNATKFPTALSIYRKITVRDDILTLYGQGQDPFAHVHITIKDIQPNLNRDKVLSLIARSRYGKVSSFHPV